MDSCICIKCPKMVFYRGKANGYSPGLTCDVYRKGHDDSYRPDYCPDIGRFKVKEIGWYYGNSWKLNKIKILSLKDPTNGFYNRRRSSS